MRMATPPAWGWRGWRRAALAGLFLLVGAAHAADPATDPPVVTGPSGPPPAGGAGSLDVGVGWEQLSSPVVRLSPDSTLVRIEGLTRLSGAFARVAAGAMRDWPLGDELRVAISGRIDWKFSPRAHDLRFGFANLDAMVRWPVAGWTIGAGPAWQSVHVAGQRFREVGSLHLDATRVEPGGSYLAVVWEAGRTRHRGDYTDLDSRVMSLSVHRKLKSPGFGLDGLDLDVGARRETNAHGYTDLANRSAYLRVSADRRWAQVTWSLGAMLQRALFDGALLESMAARRDRYLMLDAAAEVSLGPGRTARLEVVSARNAANLAMFENRYRQVMATVALAW